MWFLPDAALGLMKREKQHQFFSVVAVVFRPPPLVASIYGADFGATSHLRWMFGYTLTHLLMVIAQVTPFI